MGHSLIQIQIGHSAYRGSRIAGGIDINVAWLDYWRNNRPVGGTHSYKNHIPWEIVEVFEKHGFIWGGKWYHDDTMHFEYRPELLP